MVEIFGIVIAIIIAIVPFIWKTFVLRPEVTIEIIKYGSSSTPKGLSAKNKLNEDGYIVGATAIQIFELTWRFKIRITNNSEVTALYPELKFNSNGPKFRLIDKLNKLEPIKTAETIELSVEYRKYEEKQGNERSDTVKETPLEFSDLELLLSYQNLHK